MRRSALAIFAREQDVRVFPAEGGDKRRKAFGKGGITRGEHQHAGVFPASVDPFQNFQNDCPHQFRYIHDFTRR